jgi:phosphatidylserine decarboxylase
MNDILYIDRVTKKQETEKVYGKAFIEAMYGSGPVSYLASLLLSPLVCKSPLLSHLYGFLQKTKLSQRKVLPFIEKFHVDPQEFLDPISSYASFNDFFIRKLKPSARPIATGHDVAILPADARYLFYPRIDEADGFLVKGKKFTLDELLQDKLLAERYQKGAMVIARLCPTDYHRFHFPCSCLPGNPRILEGNLESVNPLALRKNIQILAENKRCITSLQTKNFGQVLYIEVGATFVGGIFQTFTPSEPYAKGDEKGYFSFGGSSLILLFEPGTIQFDQDLVDASQKKIEIRGLLGQSMGRCLSVL